MSDPETAPIAGDTPALYAEMKALEYFSQVEADRGNDQQAIKLLERAARIAEVIGYDG